jgi:aconitate hydratase
MRVSGILKGKTVHKDVSLVIAPGSKQVLTMLAQNGALADLIASGARILESACGPCIGMGQAPKANAVSLRTFNRNFEGRCGTVSAGVYLVSPEVAAVSAVAGVLTDPRTLGNMSEIVMPEKFSGNDNMIVPPAKNGDSIRIIRGENIKPFPRNKTLTGMIEGKVLIKLGDNITTDHIIPSNARLLPFRSNIPYLAQFCLTPCDPQFPKRAKENTGGIIVGGENYGQGSSREHAALAPLQLGIRGVIAKSFARIHMANLINMGISAMTFLHPDDYDTIDPGDLLAIHAIKKQLPTGRLTVKNMTKNKLFTVNAAFTKRQQQILLAGGLLNFIKQSTPASVKN